MNPLTYLDAILSDYASAKTRRLIHTLILLVGVVVTAVLAAGGDWKVALATLAAALYAGANHANTVPEDESVSGNTYESLEAERQALIADGVNPDSLTVPVKPQDEGSL